MVFHKNNTNIVLIRDDQYTIDRHTLNGRIVNRNLAKNLEAHIFLEVLDLEVLESIIWSLGSFQGNIRGWDRYFYQFEMPIGVRIQPGKLNIELYVAEIKGKLVDGVHWTYHLVPRTRPAMP